jgi:hypothetical protein
MVTSYDLHIRGFVFRFMIDALVLPPFQNVQTDSEPTEPPVQYEASVIQMHGVLNGFSRQRLVPVVCQSHNRL